MTFLDCIPFGSFAIPTRRCWHYGSDSLDLPPPCNSANSDPRPPHYSLTGGLSPEHFVIRLGRNG